MLAEFVENLEVETPVQHGAFVVWPVRRAAGAPPAPASPAPAVGSRYSSLVEALEDGFVSIDEPRAATSRASVRVTNRSTLPVLVLRNERVGASGALRATNSVLVPGRGRLDVPVRSSARCIRGAAATPLGGSSAARAGCVGFLLAHRGSVVGAELVGRPELVAPLWTDLLRPHLCRVPIRPTRVPRGRGAVHRWLRSLAGAPVLAGRSPGLGWELTLVHGGLRVQALAAPHVVHLSADSSVAGPGQARRGRAASGTPARLHVSEADTVRFA